MSSVLAIGNALVDILIRLDNDSLLKEFNLAKGSMQLSDMETVNSIIEKTKNLPKHKASGGSAANTIHGLSKLGINTGFIGKIGQDEIGQFFKKDMEECNICTKLSTSITPSGRAIALVSPDSERTFATYLGASIQLNSPDLEKNLFEGYKYFHVEGYLLQNHDLMKNALKLAKQEGMITSLDLASYNVVKAHIDFLFDIIEEYVDIVFANEEEAKALVGQRPEIALREISQFCNIAVVKIGKEGSLIKKGDEIHRVNSIKVNAIDTTGAGDLYAAGFIYGLINNLSLDKCGKIGSLIAGNVIEVIGAKMDEERWKKIYKQIEEIK